MKKIFSIILFFATFAGFVSAQSPVQYPKSDNLDKSGLAIQGYDPVSYFTENKAKVGSKDFSFIIQGVTYYFTTARDRLLFKDNPLKYEPQYGGWCAYAMGATGEKVNIDPGTFKILNGKLYLFYNQFFNNTRKSWNKDEAHLKTKADINWAKINYQSKS
jgi:YHS domain-containing protein